MDPVKNPYNPNAGAPPPALVGREELLQTFEIALARCKASRGAKSLMPTGLRGVGKTVLLNRFVEQATRDGYRTAYLEADENTNFIEMLAGQLRPVLFGLARSEVVREGVKRALRVFKSFTLNAGLQGLSLHIGVDPERGIADSGDLNLDLTALFCAIGEAAQDEKTGILIAIDEVQYLSEVQLGALIMAVHRTTQLALPLMLVATGLPQIPALAGNAKSYAERLFDFPMLGALSEADARRAIAEPAHLQGASFSDGALRRLYEITQGYPFFIQEWAYHVWNYAAVSPITLDDVNGIEPRVLQRLDESFFRVRYDRLTPTEKNYLRAMAERGPGPHRSGEIAASLGVKSNAVGPVRDALTKKGMIYSPQFGETAFTVPLFDAFMLRTAPILNKHVPRARRSAR